MQTDSITHPQDGCHSETRPKNEMLSVADNRNVDARGSSITAEQFRRSMDKVHQQSVKDAVAATHDIQRRR